MGLLERIFRSKSEQRLRAGWRIVLYTLLWIFAPAVVARAFGEWLALPVASAFPTVAGFAPHAVAVLIKLVVVLVITWFAVGWIDRRTLRDFGLWWNRDWWLDFAFGLILGGLLMTLIFVVEWLAGWVQVRETLSVAMSGVSFGTAILGALFFFVVVGITEELLARGYQLRNLAEGLNVPAIGPTRALILGWLFSSSFFGLLHVFNPNATWYSTLALMVAGLFLGLGFVLTRSLAIPIALHITWNFFQGNVYGFPVSGNTFESATFIVIEQQGPPMWTGGAFGPEAGLLGIFTILLGCGVTLLWVRWRYGRVRLQPSLAEYRSPEPPLAQLGE
jgi:membrane protease YdiL (CAAX protease family)